MFPISGGMWLPISWYWEGRPQICGNWATGSVSVGEVEVAWSWEVIEAILVSIASMISFFRLLTASQKSALLCMAVRAGLLFWLAWFPSRFACLEVVHRVPMMCGSLQSVVRHSPADNDCGHILGWNLSQLVPALHPLGPRFLCLISLGHGFGCFLLKPFPDMSWRQVPLLYNGHIPLLGSGALSVTGLFSAAGILGSGCAGLLSVARSLLVVGSCLWSVVMSAMVSSIH